MSDVTCFRVERRDHAVVISGGGRELFFEPDDRTFLPLDATFAAWALLPVAMASVGDILIEGVGDAVAEANARQLARIWSLWAPEWFRPASITFARHDAGEQPGKSGDLVLFSGGVDSVFNLLRRHRSGMSQSLLTLHGLDYRIDADAKFDRLVEKTSPVVEMTGSPRILMKTNAYSFYRSFGIGETGLTHGFVLAAALFAAGSPFGAGEIAADYARHQEFIVAPWGTNSVTNAMFESASFKMKTACLDLTRAQKMEALLSAPKALESLSFCKDYESRPDNCGVCSKCVRTKYMFLAVGGTVPPIFSDMSINHKLIRKIDIGKRSERAFFLDLVAAAKEHGTIALLPGLQQMADSLFRRPSPVTRFARKQWESVRKRI
ncbi:MAG: hypothetical protein ACTHLP_11510 [Rhizobiaceae bacterium]